jgi:hypothetical protein
MVSSGPMLDAWKKIALKPGRARTVYHGTYKSRAAQIQRQGLRMTKGGKSHGEVWFAGSPYVALRHAAVQASKAGCSGEPLSLVKVKLRSTEQDPVYYAVSGAQDDRGKKIHVYHVGRGLGPGEIDSIRVADSARDKKAIDDGILSAVRQKRFRANPQGSCPPEIGLFRRDAGQGALRGLPTAGVGLGAALGLLALGYVVSSGR